jgi:hypothetical protein
MNVGKYWCEQQRLYNWICHSTANTRTGFSNNDPLNRISNQFYHGPTIRYLCFYLSAQLIPVVTSHPIRVFPITNHNNCKNSFSFLKPLLYSSSFQRHFHRFHFAASSPIVNIVNRQSRWKAKHVHKSMVAQYGPNYRRRRLTVEKFPENMVKIEFMHSIDDVQIYHKRYHLISEKVKWTKIDEGDDDTPGIFRVEWVQSAIMQLAFDYYGEDCADQLEFYNYQTNNWKPIPDDIHNDMEMINLYKGKGNRTMPLRLPSDFDDGHVSDDDIEVEKLTKFEKFERAEAEAVRIIFRRLMDKLRRERYVRISNTSLQTTVTMKARGC